MSRLQDAKAPIRDAMREFSRTHQKEGERFPIGVMAMELQAGKGFSHHDHLNYHHQFTTTRLPILVHEYPGY